MFAQLILIEVPQLKISFKEKQGSRPFQQAREYARRPTSTDLIDWADHIFVMEEKHREAILVLRPDAESKVVVLNIPDIYVRNDTELVQILKTRLSEHLHIEWDD